jgi:hypothetical protein
MFDYVKYLRENDEESDSDNALDDYLEPPSSRRPLEGLKRREFVDHWVRNWRLESSHAATVEG